MTNSENRSKNKGNSKKRPRIREKGRNFSNKINFEKNRENSNKDMTNK